MTTEFLKKLKYVQSSKDGYIH